MIRVLGIIFVYATDGSCNSGDRLSGGPHTRNRDVRKRPIFPLMGAVALELRIRF